MAAMRFPMASSPRCSLVDLTVAHTGKAAGAGKPLPEPAYTGKQVDKLDSRYITPFLIFCGAAARMRGIPPFGENKKAPGGWNNPVPGARLLTRGSHAAYRGFLGLLWGRFSLVGGGGFLGAQGGLKFLLSFLQGLLDQT